jgi:hypothetical protein
MLAQGSITMPALTNTKALKAGEELTLYVVRPETVSKKDGKRTRTWLDDEHAQQKRAGKASGSSR